jgi:ABC-type antimicrobial peptide transport system permease subunit
VIDVIGRLGPGRREMGVRVALGASPRAVRTGLQREALFSVGVGAGIGLLLSLALGRGLETLLFGVGATDPVSLVGALTAFLVAAFVASWIPARRPARADPAGVLRED